MSPKLSKILVPVDDSKHSWRAIDHAIAMAKKTKSAITCLYVIQTIQESEFKSSGPRDDDKRIAADILKRISSYAMRKGIKIKTRIDHGHAGYCIVKHAHSKAQKFDLVIIGSRGKGKIRKMIFGSTSNYVLNESSLPVLVIK